MSSVDPAYGRMLQLDRARADPDASAADRAAIDRERLNADTALSTRAYARLRTGGELLSRAAAAHEARHAVRDGHVDVRA